MQSFCFGFEQHRRRWAVFSAAFHHAERAPRVISSLTAESPTIRSFKTSFGPDIGSLTTRVLRARKTRKFAVGRMPARPIQVFQPLHGRAVSQTHRPLPPQLRDGRDRPKE